MSDRARVISGFTAVDGGVDSSQSPLLIGSRKMAWGVNCAFRTNQMTPRPGFAGLTVTWASETAQEAYEDGVFQGSSPYTDAKGKPYLVASVSGRIFAFALGSTVSAFELTSTDLNNPNRPMAYFCQAGSYLVIQDGQDAAFIWNGVTLRRSVAADKEVPVGTWMAYGNGRLWLAQGKQYIGGDLINSNPLIGEASLLRFTENDVINEGGGFPVPGVITGFAFVARQDSVAGVGSLIVFTANSIFEFNAPIDRTVWKNLEYPIQSFALLAFGTESGRSITGVNGDLFFRAVDGIRSFFWARRDFNTPGNTPVSAEVTRAIDDDSQALLGFSSSVNFANRLHVTGAPRWTDRGVIHQSLYSLDFDPISGIGPKKSMAWDGIWTGVRWFQLHTIRVDGIIRCYGFALGSDGAITIFEVTTRSKSDSGTPIEWSFETPRIDFAIPQVPKALDTAQFSVNDVTDTVLCRLRYRPNGIACWQPWHAWKECGQVTICPVSTPEVCQTLETAVPQAFAQGSLPRPAAAYDSTNCIVLSEGFDFQFRLEFQGYMTISMWMFMAEARPPSHYGAIRSACDPDCIPSFWKIT